MKSYNFQSGEEGKGSLGCMFSLVLMVIALFLAFKLAPPYIGYYELKGELKQAVSRAAMRPSAEENTVKDLIRTAEKNKVLLKKENIKIRRFAGQLYINIEYTVPVDFIIIKRDFNFKMEESSFTLS